MQGVGAKLSKHVLGMKFMRKTKDQLDKDKVEKTHREHFAADIKSEVDSTTTTTSQKLTAIVEEVPSYSQCIGYNFGRVSFGGFNPIVEYNVSRGIWKAAKAGVAESDPEDEVKSEGAPEENDVPDEEMARTYGSIVGTLGKHFMNKRDRNTEEDTKNDTRQGNNNGRRNRGNRSQTPRSDTVRESQGTKKRSGWKKGRDWKKSQNNDSPPDRDQRQTQNNNQGQTQNNSQPGRSGPPQKKRKFWKPAD